MRPEKILVGVSGGIAAFKSAALVSKLAQHGFEVQVILTHAATAFVTPQTFSALSGKPVATELFDPRYPLGAHIELAQQNTALCIAPASADVIGKLANGIADDLLSTLYLCFTGPVYLAPAMNSEMWSKPSVQRNVKQLTEDGVEMIAPGEGWLSCRQQGVGRMAEAEEIFEFLKSRKQQNPGSS